MLSFIAPRKKIMTAVHERHAAVGRVVTRGDGPERRGLLPLTTQGWASTASASVTREVDAYVTRRCTVQDWRGAREIIESRQRAFIAGAHGLSFAERREDADGTGRWRGGAWRGRRVVFRRRDL